MQWDKQIIELRSELVPYGKPIIICYRGSISQGTYVPNNDPNSIDDVDVLGVYLAPIDYYCGLDTDMTHKWHRKAIERFIGEFDSVSYEFRKLVYMLLRCNPNVLSCLWLRPEHYIELTHEGKQLIEIRDAFLSRRAYESYTGYANSQLGKMTHFERKGYMGEKRKRLISKYGFDTKNAAHLIRLLTMGIEVLEEGTVKPYREHDARLYIDIKAGKWTLDRVKKEAAVLYDRAEQAFRNTQLPELPDVRKIDKVTTEVLARHIQWEYLRIRAENYELW